MNDMEELKIKSKKHDEDIEYIKKDVDCVKREVGGIGRSLNQVRIKQDGLIEEVGMLKGLSLSLDGEYHTISERLHNYTDSLKEFKDEIKNDLQINRKEMNEVRKSMWKATLTTIISVLTIVAILISIVINVAHIETDMVKKANAKSKIEMPQPTKEPDKK